MVGHGGRWRLYTRWPAKSRFVCRGHCITGGEAECPVRILGGISLASVATWLCVLLPSTFYFLVALPNVIRRWNPQPFFLLPLASLVLFVATIVFLLATCCSNPGIIPRRQLVLATGTRTNITALLGHDLLGPEGMVPSGDAIEDATKMVATGLRQRGYRWCHTCQIVRPPRASHCRDCDHCVMRFDHHCPFVNNCIGQRNYHFFIGFTTAAMLLAALVVPTLMWCLFANEVQQEGSKLAVAWLRLAALVGCYTMAGTALLLVVLWIYHLWLVLRGKTTKEHLTGRGALDISGEPTLCAPRGPQLFDPHAWVDPAVLTNSAASSSAVPSGGLAGLNLSHPPSSDSWRNEGAIDV